MAESEPRRVGVSIELKPHAYDPAANPELFEGVLARRCIAFLIDFIIIGIPVLLASLFIFIVGLVTFGLGWLLYWLIWPATVIWAIAYLSQAGAAGLGGGFAVIVVLVLLACLGAGFVLLRGLLRS